MVSATIFGSGNMGGAISDLLSGAGASVQHVEEGENATIAGELVVLAVPYEALRDIVENYGDQLRDRVVVDITNPVDFESFDALKVPAHSSAAAELAAALPGARVVKAFNINFAGTLSAKQVGPNQTTVLVAADDGGAKQTVIDAAQDCGLRAVDAGALARARELEAMGFLQISLANDEKVSWSAGFGLVTG